jgi:hypothetical protein
MYGMNHLEVSLTWISCFREADWSCEMLKCNACF